MSIQTVNAEIFAGNFTNEQLTSIVEAIKYVRAQMAKASIRSLQVGDNVTWDSVRTGRNSTGKVVKIAQKFVTVKVDHANELWKVPANMLHRVEEFA